MASMVNRGYQDQIKGCLETWKQDCDLLGIPVFFFCGQENGQENGQKENGQKENGIIHLEGVKDDPDSATDKQWLGLKWMHQFSPSEWYLLAGSDNYIYPDRILKELQKIQKIDLETKEEGTRYLGGHAGVIDLPQGKVKFFSGSGFLLNHAALTLLLEKLDNFSDIRERWYQVCTYKYLRVACDVAMGYFCDLFGIKFITLEGIHACDLQGYDPGRTPCCTIDYQTCLILHRCNNYDHYSIRRYAGSPAYKTLYYCYFTSQKDLVYGPLVNQLYQLGLSISGIHDHSPQPSYLLFPLLRGLIDSLRTEKVFISSYTEDPTVKSWIQMANLRTSGSLGDQGLIITEDRKLIMEKSKN